MDMMPTTVATFKQYLSSLVVTLHTLQECNTTDSAGYQLDDVEDDDAWSPRPKCRPRATAHALDQIHRANLSITIEPVARQTFSPPVQIFLGADSTLHPGRPTHYMAAGAQAPMLHASQAAAGVSGDETAHDVAFQPLSHVVIREADGQLLASRYDSYGGMHRWRDDGHRNHAGQVWARKVQRDKEAVESLRHDQARVQQDGALQALLFQLE